MTDPAFWVIVLGSFAGGICRGVTGFGSAIILVLFWVTAKILTLQPGPLGLTIVSDCISSVASAVPLFVLTKAHKTSDWRLVSTLLIFKTALSPLGAVMLVVLNKRVIELAMALCLVAVIAMQTDIKGTVIDFCRRLRNSRDSYRDMQLLATSDMPKSCDTTPIHVVVSASNGSTSMPATLCQTYSDTATAAFSSQTYAAAYTTDSQNLSNSYSTTANTSDAKQNCRLRDSALSLDKCVTTAIPVDTSCCVDICQDTKCFDQPVELSTSQKPQTKLVSAVRTSSDYVIIPLDEANDCTSPATHNDVEQVWTIQTGDKDTTQLLPTDKQQMTSCSVNKRDVCQATGQCNNTEGKVCCHATQGFARTAWSKMLRIFTDKENQRVLGLGSLAGSVSGVMDGMTGMGGPPIMYLYSKLNVVKDTARGVGASLNLFQFRLIAYIALGVFERKYVPLYVSATCVHMAGITLGTLVLNKHINQQAFKRILTSLMCACCTLLFAAAAGVTGS